MAIKLDGTGYLKCTSKILSALPITMIAFGTRTSSSGTQTWVSQSQSDGARHIRAYLPGSSDYKSGQHYNTSGNAITQKGVAPHVSSTSTTMRMHAFEVPNINNRTVRFGESANPATNTVASGTPPDDLISHNQVYIGALQYESRVIQDYMKGDIAEVHFIAGIPTVAEYDAMLAGTLLPEAITGWVDGITLKDYAADGIYTSIGGRTFTAFGGVTASTATHPIARSAAPDTTAPTLTSPSATQTGSTSGSGSVSTNEANGTLFFKVSANATETQATVLASATSQAVTASGVQNVAVTGLTASTVYYIHYVHTDAAANSSTVSSSASFTTSSGADTTAPTLTSPTATQTGSTTATGTVTTTESGGTLYCLVNTSATATVAQVKASLVTRTVTASGLQTVAFSGLPVNTLQYIHYLHRDAAGNESTVSNSASFTTAASSVATFKTYPCGNNTGTVLFANQSNVTLNLLNPATGDKVVLKTGLTSDAAGVVTMADSLIGSAVTYDYVVKFSDGSTGYDTKASEV